MTEKEEKARDETNTLMRECIDDARSIVHEKRLLENQTVLAQVAVALFEARIKSKK